VSAAPDHRSPSSYHVFSVETAHDRIDSRGLLIRAILALAAFFALVVVGAILVALSPTLSRSLTAFFIRSQQNAIPWNGTDPVNIVMAGVDARPGQTQYTRTDTIVVASIRPGSGTMHMLSIPRDLWVNIPGVGYDRVNAAYADGGARLLIQTVEGVTNMPIRYYAIIKFTGFEKVVNAVGGVNICVKHAINDPTYPAFKGNGYAPLHIKAGCQHMNGRLALEYVRTRHDDPLGDLGRNQRQQQLLQALKHQVITPAALLNLPVLLTALQRAVDTDFPYTDLTYLGRVVMTARTQHRFLNYNNNSVSNYVTAGGADVLLPNWSRIHWIARQTFHDPQLASSPVDVLNGSGIGGQASALSRWLHASGYDISAVGNAGRSNHAHTEVIRNTSVGGGDYVARMLGAQLAAPVVWQAVPSSRSPVVIIVGQNWTDPAQS
jgi:polyisoprenyl-teichoic acid--peptidoglycan teichoic acid transferase